MSVRVHIKELIEEDLRQTREIRYKLQRGLCEIPVILTEREAIDVECLQWLHNLPTDAEIESMEERLELEGIL